MTRSSETYTGGHFPRPTTGQAPEGWVLVPREPTEAMWRAHWKALRLSPKEYKAWIASDCCKRGPHESGCVSAWHAMIAAAPPAPADDADGWRPIETAPKDGTRVLLWPHNCVGWWEFGDDQWMVLAIPLNEDHTIADDWREPSALTFCVYADQLGREPLLWHPLPPPPSAEGGRAVSAYCKCGREAITAAGTCGRLDCSLDPTTSQPSPDVAGIVERLLTLKGYSDRVVAHFVQEAAQALTTLASDNKALGEERDEARRRLAASLTAAAKAWETAGVDALGIDRTHLFRRENDDPAEYEALLRAARRATDAELRAESAEARVKALEEAIRPFVTRFVDRTALPDTTILSVRRFNTEARLAYEQPMFTVGDLRRARAALSAQEGKADA